MKTAGQVKGAETASVIARPPLLFLAALLLGFVLDHISPLKFALDYLAPSSFPTERGGVAHRVLAVAPALAGLVLAIAGICNLLRAKTPVPTTQPTHALVTTGIHGWTRNPIYLGFFLIYVGVGIAVRSPSILFLTLPLATIVHYGVVVREEAYLQRRFGDAYRRYRTRVHRWL